MNRRDLHGDVVRALGDALAAADTWLATEPENSGRPGLSGLSETGERLRVWALISEAEHTARQARP